MSMMGIGITADSFVNLNPKEMSTLICLQRFEDEALLPLSNGFSSDFLQRNGSHTAGASPSGIKPLGHRLFNNLGFRPNQHMASNAVRKLANIPGPIQILQIMQHLYTQRFGLLIEFLLELCPKILSQQRYVFTSLAQTRQPQADYIDAVI